MNEERMKEQAELAAPDMADHALSFLKAEGIDTGRIGDGVRQELAAMINTAAALAPLDFQQRERVIRWVCEVLDVNRYEIGEGEDITPMVVDIRQAREVLRKALKDDIDLRLAYASNVAMCIHDSLAEFGALPTSVSDGDWPEIRTKVAERVLHILFSD